MALKNKTVEAWIGEDLVIPYGPILDSNGNNIDFASATITWRLTDQRGGGSTIHTETTSTGITILADTNYFDVAIAYDDLNTNTARTYWHECQATLQGGDRVQIQDPSRFPLRESAITS